MKDALPQNCKKKHHSKHRNKKRNKRKKKQKPFDIFAHVSSNDIGDIFKGEASRGAKTLKTGHYIKIFT